MASKKKTRTAKTAASEEQAVAATAAKDAGSVTTEAAGLTDATATARTSKRAKKTGAKEKAPKAAKPRKTSALDAAAKVLAEAGKPMNTTEMIDAMTAKKYWTSPNGLTPQATLYSAIAREIKTKGDKSRFRKADRGQFILA